MIGQLRRVESIIAILVWVRKTHQYSLMSIRLILKYWTLHILFPYFYALSYLFSKTLSPNSPKKHHIARVTHTIFYVILFNLSFYFILDISIIYTLVERLSLRNLCEIYSSHLWQNYHSRSLSLSLISIRSSYFHPSWAVKRLI